MTKNGDNAALVAVIMGSDSDFKYMEDACHVLDQLGVPFDLKILSAHRTPNEMATFASNAAKTGIRVVIAGAGGAAHLPGMVAAFSPLPVIGVPIPHGPLQGEDALLSIVQMPKGVPVATVAIGNAHNAGILAAQILAFGGLTINPGLVEALRQLKEESRMQSLKKTLKYKKTPSNS